MIEQLSRHYSCRILAEKDIPSILSLYESNPLYFQHCPPAPNLESVKEDMARLPEGKAKVDKFYVGFWDSSNLVAVMDFVYATFGLCQGESAISAFLGKAGLQTNWK